MAPTMEVDSGKAPSTVTAGWGNVSEIHPRVSVWDPSSVSADCPDLNNTCECYFGGKDMTQSFRTSIPEASPVFRETLDKMKLEHSQGFCKKGNAVGVSDEVSSISATSGAPSFLTKLKSAFKTSSTVSPHLSPRNCEGSPSVSSSTNKTGNTRRPASFGGADMVKLNAGRRASHSEKRVSWADERGSNHPLFSVKLIRPRVSTDTKPLSQSPPGHSILRNTGIF